MPEVTQVFDLLALNGFLGNISIHELHYSNDSIEYRVYNNDSKQYIDYDAKMAIRNISKNENPFFAVVEDKLIMCMDCNISVHNACGLGTLVKGGYTNE